MSKVDTNAIMKKVMDTSKIAVAFEREAKKVFEKRKGKMIKEFEQSPITMEIQAGPSASNISATLGGYGNLFSYIGFYADENPIDPIKNYLKNLKFTILKKEERFTTGSIILSLKLKWFDLDVIEGLSPMPWETGNSWVRGIERGISGFSYYMYGDFMGSRSGKGKQSKHQVNAAPTFSPRRYLSAMIKETAAKFK
jgi:hypothetical protein